MNREIKFRVWDLLSKKMIYLNDEMSGAPYYELFCRTPDSRALEIMQFTGLRDKNGKEIWEGDIVKYIHVTNWGDFNLEEVREVKFESGEFWPRAYAWNDDDDFPHILKDFEVIGNCFEHGDLLK